MFECTVDHNLTALICNRTPSMTGFEKFLKKMKTGRRNVMVYVKPGE